MVYRYLIIGSLSLLYCSVVFSQTIAAVPAPTSPFYYEPPVQQPKQVEHELDCYQLDAAINALHPYRYSYKPDFYSDGNNQLASALITFDSIPLVQGWLGIAYLGYSALVDEKEDRRTLNIEENIIMLQRLKAVRHCYE